MEAMDDRTLRLLEFHEILAEIAGRCRTGLGRQEVLSLEASTDPVTVTRLLEETDEARRLLAKAPVLLPGVSDVRSAVERSARAGVLGADEALAVFDALRGMRLTKKAVAESDPPYPALTDIVWAMPSLGTLEHTITSAVDENGVRDDASPRLKDLRRRIMAGEDAIRRRLEALVHSPEAARSLMEPIVTQRYGRWVVPVRQEARSQVPGIVHDTSQSGSTLFIEPQWAVEAQNDLAALRSQEAAEVERILAEISAAIGAEAEAIMAGLRAAARFDGVLAKASMAESWQAHRPSISSDGLIHLPSVRHPLLKGEVVPITLTFAPGEKILVITGPNTGGKTVALKTVGVMALLTQVGCHLPTSEGASLPVFRRILADIGDEQSIEQSLSTFSSHMSAIIRILTETRPTSLVLIDELGAGTDPDEGAALSVAIVEHLLTLPVLAVITTHHPDLKALALTTPGLANASVEFDETTLRPTYRLIMGAPGQSRAFLIARRLGLPEGIIDRAKGILPGHEVRMEDLIGELERRRLAAEEATSEAESARRAAKTDREAAEAALETARKTARDLTESTRQETARLLSEARRELREAIREARRVREQAAGEDALNALRDRLAAWDERLAAVGGDAQGQRRGSLESVRRGQSVFVESLGQGGRVAEVDEAKREALVEVGMMRVRRPFDDLFREDEPASAGASNWAGQAHRKAMEMSPELNVIGMRAADALLLIDKFLDDAALAGLTRIRIVHGKGTGTLRRAVAEALGQNPAVRSHRLADQSEGGAGATIVEI